MLKILIYIIAGIILLIAYIRFVESRSVFYPSRLLETTPESLGMKFEDVFFKTSDKLTLNGWLVKSNEKAPTVLYLHGNAGNISYRVKKIALFQELGLNVFIIDYRGYGNSEGVPTEEGIYLDALSAYDYLMARTDIDKNKIIVYGASLGGAFAVDLATKRNIAAIIVDSTFTSARDMARKIMPVAPGFLIKTKLDSIGKISKIKVPKLFIHSRDDEVVPFALGEKLYKAASEPKIFLEIHGGHDEGYSTSGDVFKNGINNFLKGINLL